MQRKIVTLILALENALARLYHEYSIQFPELESFWKELVKDEVHHAKIVRDLEQQVDDNSLSFNETRFKIPPLALTLKHIKGLIESANARQATLVNALSHANDIESAFIDGKYYEIFEGKSAHLRRYLQTIHDETKEHQSRVKAMWNKVRSEQVEIPIPDP